MDAAFSTQPRGAEDVSARGTLTTTCGEDGRTGTVGEETGDTRGER